MSAAYPLELHNIGEDEYLLMSKGHHDPHAFMAHVRAQGYEWPLGMPEHTYCRTMPAREDGYVCWYDFTDKPGRGTYPITYAREAYHEDRYEAIVAKAKSDQQGRVPAAEITRPDEQQHQQSAAVEPGVGHPASRSDDEVWRLLDQRHTMALGHRERPYLQARPLGDSDIVVRFNSPEDAMAALRALQSAGSDAYYRRAALAGETK